MRQQTIRRSVALEGIGLHSGKRVRITLSPAPADSGIVFRVGEQATPIPAAPESVVDSHYATTIGRNGTRIQTVEHLMAAAAGLGIDNLDVEVGRREVPAMDGSAKPFVALLHVGRTHAAARRAGVPSRSRYPLRVGNGNRWIQIVPASESPDQLHARQRPSRRSAPRSCRGCRPRSRSSTSIAPARTYGFLKDLGFLRKNGLALRRLARQRDRHRQARHAQRRSAIATSSCATRCSTSSATWRCSVVRIVRPRHRPQRRPRAELRAGGGDPARARPRAPAGRRRPACARPRSSPSNAPRASLRARPRRDLVCLIRGPRHGPQTPNARHAPGNPGRSSIPRPPGKPPLDRPSLSTATSRGPNVESHEDRARSREAPRLRPGRATPRSQTKRVLHEIGGVGSPGGPHATGRFGARAGGPHVYNGASRMHALLARVSRPGRRGGGAGRRVPRRGADLRISDLDVFLNDHELTVNVARARRHPGRLQEGIQSGIPTHVRYTVELWQYNRLLARQPAADQGGRAPARLQRGHQGVQGQSRSRARRARPT